MEILEYSIFLLGLISSFIVGGNNSATSLGILISTNALKRKYSYLLSALTIFVGVSLGSYSMQSSIYGTIYSRNLDMLESAVFSVLFASVIAFYYLNKLGIPSSLSQMLYPSMAVLVLISRGNLGFNWVKFWFTVTSWGFSPFLAIVSSITLYLAIRRLALKRKDLFSQMKIYKFLIVFSSIFTTFVTGANAIGIIVSAGLLSAPFYLVAPAYGIASALGIYLSSKKASIVVGFRVTRLGYISATSALVGSDIISEIFTLLGVPISITQTTMGGIIGLSFRSFGYDVKKQLSQVARGWGISPLVAIISSLAAFGVIKSVLGF